MSSLALYTAVVRRHAAPEARTWLDAALAAIAGPGGGRAFDMAYAAAARRLGPGTVALRAGERAALAAAGLPALDGRPLADVGRLVLLLAMLAALPAADHAPLVDAVYRRGAGREREALLAALPALPAPERFVATAVEACRTNVRSEFEAIACDNPYPARHFAEAEFNQLVLKALFIGVPLARVVGLADRVGGELRRMVGDFARERRAAGRPVPEDVALVASEPA